MKEKKYVIATCLKHSVSLLNGKKKLEDNA